MAFGEEGEEGAKIGGNGITGMMKGRAARRNEVNLCQGSLQVLLTKSYNAASYKLNTKSVYYNASLFLH